MAGFFTQEQLKSASGGRTSCVRCGLMKKSFTPKMAPYGAGQRDIMIVGEYPSHDADKRGTPLHGQELRILRSTLGELGVSLEQDCILTNAVNCYSEQPITAHVDQCRKNVHDLYLKHKPKVVLLMGTAAMTSHWGPRWPGEIESTYLWRGWHIPDHHFKFWTAPIWHPAYVGEESTDDVARVIWKMDIKSALSLLEKPLPQEITPKNISILPPLEAIEYLEGLLKRPPEYLCIDYETTGLKPHFEGHRIHCTGLAVDRKRAVVFHNSPKINNLLGKVLAEPYSRKLAQNMKFEDAWSRKILNTVPKNWFFDSMIATHILDNRPGIAGLKFQAFVQYGIEDYSSHIEPYLKSDSKWGANGKNRVHKAPQRDLLIYCGMDALLEFNLIMDQMEKMDYPQARLL